MEYLIIASVLLLALVLLERSASTVEEYKPIEEKISKYHKYTEADMNILMNEGISNKLASEMIGVSISSIRNKRRRLNS